MSEEYENAENLNEILEAFFDQGNDYLSALFPDRPFDGQPQTDTGERGRQELSGITMRDLNDCFVIGCFEASGLMPENYPKTIYDLPWDDMDPAAVRQQMVCAVEKRMGIYPNVPELVWVDEPVQDPLQRAEAKVRRLTSAMEKMHALIVAMKFDANSANAALKYQAEQEYWGVR